MPAWSGRAAGPCPTGGCNRWRRCCSAGAVTVAGIAYLAVFVTGLAAGADHGHDDPLSLRVHAAEAADSALHRDRRGAWRAAAGDRMGGRAGGPWRRGLAAVRHPVPVAAAPHAGHRPTLPGRLRPGRRAGAPRGRWRRLQHGASDRQRMPGTPGREPAADAGRPGRARLLRGRAGAGRRLRRRRVAARRSSRRPWPPGVSCWLRCSTCRRC